MVIPMKVINNPKSTLYYDLKELTLSDNFPWFYNPKATPEDTDVEEYQDLPFYSHTFLSRPKWNSLGNTYYPQEQSVLMRQYYPLLEEIIVANDLEVNALLRFNANCVHPTRDQRLTIPHNDHPFPHKNLLIYLTSSGGETMLVDKQLVHEPKEDDIIVFEGLHCMRPPKLDRRIVLVATFI